MLRGDFTPENHDNKLIYLPAYLDSMPDNTGLHGRVIDGTMVMSKSRRLTVFFVVIGHPWDGYAEWLRNPESTAPCSER